MSRDQRGIHMKSDPSTVTKNLKIMITSDNVADAKLAEQRLSAEFKNVLTVASNKNTVAEIERENPDVLILAFELIGKSRDLYLDLCRRREARNEYPPHSIIFCNRNDAEHAYELCRDRIFDDYVLFWPAMDDPRRLNMAVHRIMHELSALGGDATVAGFSGRARRLMNIGNETARKVPTDLGFVPPTGKVEGHSEAAMAQAPSARQSSGHKSRSVLLVDDDTFLHKIIGKILETEGYQVQFATDCMDALNLMRNTLPDVILMDIMMPGIDGVEMTKRIKTVPRLANIPIIMITGHGDPLIMQECLDNGAADFLVKPIDKKSLLIKIANVTQKA